MYYPCSENKGADRLRSYCEADLRLFFFRLCRLLVFPCGGSFVLLNLCLHKCCQNYELLNDTYNKTNCPFKQFVCFHFIVRIFKVKYRAVL